MLILSRRIGQSVQLGQDIEVVILGMKGNQVRVGISAPTGTSVMRKEVLERGPRPEAPAATATATPRRA